MLSAFTSNIWILGARTVIHPKAKIVAEAGPIIIGENNLIEEQAQIINRCGIICSYYLMGIFPRKKVFFFYIFKRMLYT